MVHDRPLASSNMCIAFYPFKGEHSTGSNSSMDGFAQQPGRGLIIRLTRGDVGPEIVRGYWRDLLALLIVLPTLILKAKILFLMVHLQPSVATRLEFWYLRRTLTSLNGSICLWRLLVLFMLIDIYGVRLSAHLPNQSRKDSLMHYLARIDWVYSLLLHPHQTAWCLALPLICFPKPKGLSHSWNIQSLSVEKTISSV